MREVWIPELFASRRDGFLDAADIKNMVVRVLILGESLEQRLDGWEEGNLKIHTRFFTHEAHLILIPVDVSDTEIGGLGIAHTCSSKKSQKVGRFIACVAEGLPPDPLNDVFDLLEFGDGTNRFFYLPSFLEVGCGIFANDLVVKGLSKKGLQHHQVVFGGLDADIFDQVVVKSLDHPCSDFAHLLISDGAFPGLAEFEISKGIEDAFVAMLTFLDQFRFAFDEVPHAFTDGLVGFIPVGLEDFFPFLVPLAFGGLLITGLKIDPGLFAAYLEERKICSG